MRAATSRDWSPDSAMTVLFFSQAREITGCSQMSLDLQYDLDAEALWECILLAHPGLSQIRASVRLARNGVFSDESTRFLAGDEVALIPPVSGG